MFDVENAIELDSMNQGTFAGPLASPYSYKPELRKRIDECFHAACRSANRYFVLKGLHVLAAGQTLTGATHYMSSDRVLLHVDIPDVTDEQLAQAKQMWAYVPFRKCFVALKHGEQMQVILKPTAHYASKLARQGWTVRELHRA